MTLAPLADLSDLSVRIDVNSVDSNLAETMLSVASSLVRSAAGSPIAERESEVSVWALDASCWLPLPGQPVTSVSSVTVDGSAVTSYKLADGALWRRCHWSDGYEPTEVVVTMTHGYPEVPDWIVQLVCDLAILGIKTASEGAIDPRVAVEEIDDYKVTFSATGQVLASALELPAATRLALSSRFGGGVGKVSWRA